MICDFGDVTVVPFPSTDLDLSKSRPALVLSSGAFHAAIGQTIVAMVTTASRSDWPSDIVLADNQAAGLLHPSRVRLKLFTLPNELITRRIGGLGAADRKAVRTAVRHHLPLK